MGVKLFLALHNHAYTVTCGTTSDHAKICGNLTEYVTQKGKRQFLAY